MSFELSPLRHSVAFEMTTGKVVGDAAQAADATCILDIHSNLAMNMVDFGLELEGNRGNYSKWVTLAPNEGIAVTGLTSCGAIFVANGDFSRVAAGHMSGDAQFVEEWCASLMKSSVTPTFILYGTGTSGSRETGGKVLSKYMKYINNLPPVRAPAVASCGSIFLVRSTRGLAVASRNPELPFKRKGQAVRAERTKLSEVDGLMLDYLNLKDYDEDNLANFVMLISALGHRVGVPVGLAFDEVAQKELLAQHGKDVIKRYGELLAKMPPDYKQDFLKFEIFKRYPHWKF